MTIDNNYIIKKPFSFSFAETCSRTRRGNEEQWCPDTRNNSLFLESLPFPFDLYPSVTTPHPPTTPPTIALFQETSPACLPLLPLPGLRRLHRHHCYNNHIRFHDARALRRRLMETRGRHAGSNSRIFKDNSWLWINKITTTYPLPRQDIGAAVWTVLLKHRSALQTKDRQGWKTRKNKRRILN